MVSGPLRAREGDLLLTKDGLFFDVKGYVHPPGRVVAFLRYLPSGAGERALAGERYAKVYDLGERWKILEERYPTYIFYDWVFHARLQGVPNDSIKALYEPKRKLEEILARGGGGIEAEAAEMARAIAERSGCSTGDLGVTGSILAGLQLESSDIDLVVYGLKQALKVREALSSLLEEGKEFKPCDEEALYRIYKARGMDKALSFEVFRENERGKALQGKFRGRDYFVRCVKDWGEVDEVYGDKIYYPEGRARIEATVVDARESVLTPCRYAVSRVKTSLGRATAVTEVSSFRGRFCEQASEGDRIEAEGKLERVVDRRRGEETYRLLLGEDPRDFMVVKGR